LQAKSEMESAEGEYKQASEDYERIYKLYPASASKSDLDAAQGARERTRGRFLANKAKYEMYMAGNRSEDKETARREWEQSKANWELLKAGTREEDKEAAKARYDEAAGRLAELRVNYAEKDVVAKEKAIVEVVSVRAGDLVPPNQPIIRVLRADDLWIKVYVPEPQLSKVRLHQKVQVHIDAYPDTAFEGTVIQVAT